MAKELQPALPPKDGDKRTKKKISRHVVRATRLIRDGEAVGLPAVASILNVEHKWLAAQFRKERVNAYLVREAKTIMLAAVMRAAQRKLELLERGSDKVANQIANEILALAGIKADADPKRGAVNVNIAPGYVIKLGAARHEAAEPVQIDAEAVEVDDEAELARFMSDLG